MSATLIIGIGTSGLEIIEQAQQFHYEFTGKNRPGTNVEYLYLETNENRNPKKTATGSTDIIAVKVPLDSGAATFNRMKANQDIDSSWVSSPELKGYGAGGTPSYGRLSIWDPKHFSNLTQNISSAHQRLGKGNTKILIVGTLTGGTGSGLCIDIAYLANKIVSGGKSLNTNGLFLLPDTLSFGEDKDLFVNSFSALAALNKYEVSGGYKTKFLDGTEVFGIGTPYEFIQYLSQEFNDSRPRISKSDLVRVAGISVALQIMDTNMPEGGTKKHFSSLLNERRVDSKGKELIKNSLSCGFTMIQYPKYQIEELLSIQLAKEVIESLIDNENYIDKNGNKKSIKSDSVNVEKRAKENFERILKIGYEHLDGIKVSNGKLLAQSFEGDVESMIKKNHGQPTNKAFYYSLFKTGTDGNYFDLISANKSTLRDKLIEEIYDYINSVTNEFKNIHITEIVIEQFINYISEITKFYKDQYRINGQDNSWDRILQDQITAFNNDNNLNTLLLTKREATLFVLNQTAELAKIHNCITLLEQIREELQTGSLGLRSINSEKELPSKDRINQILEDLELLITGRGEGDTYSLSQRESEINSLLSSNSSCFRMLYVSGSKDQDIELAYNNYKKSIDSRLSVNNLFNVTDIWPYLLRMEDVYTNCIKNSLSFVRDYNFVGNADLINIIKNITSNSPDRDIKELFSKQPELIKREHVPPLIKLDTSHHNFMNDGDAKLIFVSKSHSELNNRLIENYKLDPGVAGSNASDIPDLNNTIIIYQEYGYMGDNLGVKETFEPIKHISYMPLVKEHLRKITNQEFKMKKVPYLSLEEFKVYIQ